MHCHDDRNSAVRRSPVGDGIDLPRAWSGEGQGIVACLFIVRRSGAQWRLDGEGLEPTVFVRGGDAERQARRLAKGVARYGCDARVNIYDARGELAGAITYYACRSAPGPEVSRQYPWAPASEPCSSEQGAAH